MHYGTQDYRTTEKAAQFGLNGAVFIHWNEKLLPDMSIDESENESHVEPNLVGRIPVLETNERGTKLPNFLKMSFS